jgi:hypothetical protein
MCCGIHCVNLEWYDLNGCIISKLQVVNMGKSPWTKTQMTVLQMVSSTVTTKSQGLTEFVCHEAYDHFGIWHPNDFSAKGQTVNARYYKYHFQHHLCRAVRKMHSELVQNVIIMCVNATVCSADTVKIVFLCWGWEVLQYPSYFPDLGHVIISDSQTEAAIAWETFWWQDIWRAVWHVGGIGWRVGRCWWCLSPFFSLATNCRVPTRQWLCTHGSRDSRYPANVTARNANRSRVCQEWEHQGTT